MSVATEKILLRIGYSADPDDAFMWWPLLGADDDESAIDTGRFRFAAVLDDIQSLNDRAASGGGELEVTAMSAAQYPHVADRYMITSCGSSLGDGYGPKLVAKKNLPTDNWQPTTPIAVPGTRTSAFAALSMMLGKGNFEYEVVPFDSIIERIAAGEFDAGLVIHEGQLTFGDAGLHLIADLGKWWSEREGLPLPLGVNCVRRDLEETHGPGTLREIATILLRSVEYALEHREQSIAHALQHARGMAHELADEYVSMYVNRWTLDFGDTGRSAMERFFARCHDHGLTPRVPALDFIASA